MESILEETGWSFSGVVDLIQSDQHEGKNVLCRIIAEYYENLPELEEALKKAKSLTEQQAGLLTLLKHVRKHLRLPAELHVQCAAKDVYTVRFCGDDVEVTCHNLL